MEYLVPLQLLAENEFCKGCKYLNKTRDELVGNNKTVEEMVELHEKLTKKCLECSNYPTSLRGDKNEIQNEERGDKESNDREEVYNNRNETEDKSE